MVDVYWLEQTEADVPLEDGWLSTSEALCLHSMRFIKRRTDWRLGRWTAKQALAISLNIPTHPESLAGIEIRPVQSGAPEVFLANRSAPVTISLSHRAGSAACAVAMSGAALGCDLEVIEPRSDAFVADYFTIEEQALVTCGLVADRPRLSALIWSAKESALKALREGLRFDTRCVNVRPLDELSGDGRLADPTFFAPSPSDLNNWCPLQVCYTTGQTFSGWWQQNGNLLRTLVAAPPPAPPILLKTPNATAPPMDV
jgi:4'-phosphopantetheinyl transferase